MAFYDIWGHTYLITVLLCLSGDPIGMIQFVHFIKSGLAREKSMFVFSNSLHISNTYCGRHDVFFFICDFNSNVHAN